MEVHARPGEPTTAKAREWDDLVDGLVRLVAGDARPTREEELVIDAARERAGRLAGTGATEREGWPLAALDLVADLVCGLLVERDWSRDEIQAIVGGSALQLGLAPQTAGLAIFGRAVAERHLFDLPATSALDAQLRLFYAFAPITHASIWTRGGEARAPERVSQAGDAAASRRLQAAARTVLDGEAVEDSRGTAQIHALPIVRFGRPAGALVFRRRPAGGPLALAFGRELAVRLVPTLERRALVALSATRERTAAETNERRLKRLGLDLHDGPIQAVLALGSEVRLFRTQLASAIGPHEHLPKLLGRVDDFDARLVALDRELRELANSLETPTVLKAPLPELVRAEVDAFRGRTGVDVDLRFRGSFEPITASQGIALLRIVQEALQNVESHSAARHVQVALDGDRDELHVAVVDDGRGFDVDSALVRAARNGRLGLVGMGERVRLLDGRFDVHSASGGPTHVSATIPRWKPPNG